MRPFRGLDRFGASANSSAWCWSSVMIGSHRPFATTTPLCSRRPAIRPDDRIDEIVCTVHGRPVTVGTPRVFQSVQMLQTDSPVSTRSAASWM